MERLVVITTSELADGFRLAGAHTVPADSAADAETRLRECVEAERGVVAVHEPWLEAVDPVFRRELDRRRQPLVVALPAGDAEDTDGARRDRLLRMLERAVGYEITFDGSETR